MAPAGLFSALPEVEKDEVFALLGQFRADNHPQKVNLGAGVYLSDEGKSWPLQVVADVETAMHEAREATRHDYIPIEGDDRFLTAARDLLFSASFPTPLTSGHVDVDAGAIAQANGTRGDGRVVSVQTVSGTGANHVAARFLAEHARPRCVWVSDPTWANHHVIWQAVGVPCRTYPYYDRATCSLDFAGMMDVLSRDAQPGDAILLHACAHNPTGLDPSREQWTEIASLCARRGLFPVLDNAYQGFASGDPVEDAWAVRHFYAHDPPMDMCVAQSFSKSFGLYGQRAGALHLVLAQPADDAVRGRCLAHLAQLIRSEYSVAPRHGSSIVRAVLESRELSAAWCDELRVMSGRIRAMRGQLRDELVRLGTPGSWDHITQQIGMFSYTGLTPDEVAALKDEYHIYLLSSGRASVAGLNTTNVKYVAAAIDAVRRRSVA